MLNCLNLKTKTLQEAKEVLFDWDLFQQQQIRLEEELRKRGMLCVIGCPGTPHAAFVERAHRSDKSKAEVRRASTIAELREAAGSTKEGHEFFWEGASVSVLQSRYYMKCQVSEVVRMPSESSLEWLVENEKLTLIQDLPPADVTMSCRLLNRMADPTRPSRTRDQHMEVLFGYCHGLILRRLQKEKYTGTRISYGVNPKNWKLSAVRIIKKKKEVDEEED